MDGTAGGEGCLVIWPTSLLSLRTTSRVTAPCCTEHGEFAADAQFEGEPCGLKTKNHRMKSLARKLETANSEATYTRYAGTGV